MTAESSGRLAGRVCIITGAARGQGAAEVQHFTNEGAIVVSCDIIDGDGITHLDVTSETEWTKLVASIIEMHGRIDVLINNAGVHASAPIHQMTLDSFRQVLDVNLVGPFLGIRTVSQYMPPGSSIVNIASINGIAAQRSTAGYTASKFGVRGLTKAAALDLGPLGIRVNAILPGVIRTPMVADVIDEHEDQLATGLPLGRIGEPMDVAAAAVFLASNESQWITGIDLAVDGGHSAQTPRLI
ncbi:MAG: SDR family oxidoreductase [Ilumatobacteraceae bacterium]